MLRAKLSLYDFEDKRVSDWLLCGSSCGHYDEKGDAPGAAGVRIVVSDDCRSRYHLLALSRSMDWRSCGFHSRKPNTIERLFMVSMSLFCLSK